MSVDASRCDHEQEPTSAVFAEAAAWVARLHGPNRTTQVEQGLRRWLQASPAHAAAFEAITAGWEIAGRLPKESLSPPSRWQRAGYRDGFIRSAVAFATIAAVVVGALLYMHRLEGVTTRIGEQRTLSLEDGTRITLNTDTRVTVSYDEHVRSVELKHGEALFEVAKRPNWPFIVKAGHRQVKALGTAFVVRRDVRELTVTLVEGKVAIAPVDISEAAIATLGTSAVPGEFSADATAAPAATDAIAYLVPGERLIFDEGTAPKLDRPAIEKVTAWRRGLVDFERTPLADAVVEMNRYSVVTLRVEDPIASAIPITGVFRAGDAPSFAAAIARAYGLQVIQTDDGIHLQGAPHAL